MQATEKQLQFVAGIVHNLAVLPPGVQNFLDSMPRNSEKFPDTRADYRELILAERLKGLSTGQVDYIIKAYRGLKGFSFTKARNIITSMF